MKRDIDRIETILDLIRQIWNKQPELRLGQLLCNLQGSNENTFYYEDEQLIKDLQEMLDILNTDDKEETNIIPQKSLLDNQDKFNSICTDILIDIISNPNVYSRDLNLAICELNKYKEDIIADKNKKGGV